jgi:F0F1-type ATP synthase assembly protein I
MMTATVQGSATKKELSTVQMFGLFGEIGYLIAIPAVLFGFGGAYLDRTLGTSPLFILTGMALAIAISILAVWRRIKPLLDS